jgi:predicted GNAT family acetyltransferase
MSEITDGAPTPDVTVVDNPDADRYDGYLDGEHVGFVSYVALTDRVVLTHAEVDPQRQHQGVGGALTRGVLDAVIASGRLVTPLCPFVVAYVVSHPAYLDHVDAAHRRALAARTGNAPAERAAGAR